METAPNYDIVYTFCDLDSEKCDIEKINDMFVKPLYLEKSQAEKMAVKND